MVTLDTIEAIRKRRSTKKFLPNSLPREKLEALIDLARLSPSGGNKNTWRFVVITRPDSLQRLSQIGRTCEWLSGAPAGIAIAIAPTSTRYWLEDTAIAAYSIWLAATAQGLGVAWAAMYQSDNPDETRRRQQVVRDTLAVLDSLTVPMILGVGYPASSSPEKERPSLAEILFWERYPLDKMS